MVKKFAIGVVIVLVVIQFIRPPKNQAEGISENDISSSYGIPEAVHAILVEKCYDCHSNNTHYPWYFNIQPVGWWMNGHIDHAKEHLDFSEFKAYNDKKARHKLEELSEMVTDGTMPLASYLWIHRSAKVSPNEVAMINNWIQSQGIKIKSVSE